MRRFFVFFTTIVLLVLVVFPLKTIRADEYEDIIKQLDDLKRNLQLSQNATKNNEANLANLQKQLNSIKTQVEKLTEDINTKEKEVKRGEEALVYQKKLLDGRAVSYYKNLDKNPVGVMDILIGENISESLQNFFYQKSLIDEDRKAIINIVLYIRNLENKKKNLEEEKNKLGAIKDEVDKQSTFLAGEVAKSKKYESELSSKIAQLSARQQQLVAQKQASLNIPQSAATTAPACIDDRTKDPGFSSAFAFFTYGVPNRTGLNQYGAKGRAEAGQGYEDILKAYYNFDSIQDGANAEIKVNNGNGINQGDIIWTGNLEEYVKRIYEVPADWHINALKAQAVAARSYVLASTNNGANSICANQYCQVFKTDPKGGQWDQAVNDTSGKVMIQGGQPIKAWFSSTHGGYVLSSGEVPGWSSTSWTKHATDTTTGGAGSFSDLQNNAYDKSSPWFYCDWGSRPQYNKTAWLRSSELADIVNVILLAKRDSSVGEHLYQTDTSNPAGTDTWDSEKVKMELKNRGGSPFGNVSDVSVGADFSSGKTTSVNINGDGGSQTFDASEFKNWFNLRAPANIQIVGPLYNVEKR